MAINKNDSNIVKNNKQMKNQFLVSDEELKQIEKDLEENTEDVYNIRPDKNIPMNELISDYLHMIGPYKTLSKEEEHELMVRYKNGDDSAKDEMMMHNLKLVVNIAKKYANNNKSMDLMDLIQEGNLGLEKAVRYFDEERGYKFSTYATWWVKQAITRSIADKDKQIRVPVHLADKLRIINKAYAKLQTTREGNITPEDIDEFLNKPKGFTRNIKQYEINMVSFDLPINEGDHGEDTTLGEFIPDTSQSTEEQVVDIARNEELDKILRMRLTEKEYEIIKMRFGYYGGKIMTLEEVGKKYSVTRERIRQIEEKAIKKLRYGRTGQKLKSFL